MTHSSPPGADIGASPEVAGLLMRLEDPRVASGLQNLLDHVDLLAILAVGLDGFVARSELIGGALADSVTELRTAAEATKPAEPVDLAGVVTSLVALSSALPKFTPTITRVADEDFLANMLDSGIFSPDSLAHIGLLASAVNQGASAAAAQPIQIKGAMSMYRQIKDPDIARGLGYTLSILKAVGRVLATDQQKGQ
ncbi:DUF1641 domain-containing protein [Microbacterium sp.]|uniref:DUF1641 domain-containing protein n=1 Tax=Microbacterium sp. TaxID=51671 RepID=UPI0027330554|nr:DUF1641 domain-containing protein [Microbacterium sp.]MDP3950183.1 DUF1641 domain-containing protein [Microbacterium sp.]